MLMDVEGATPGLLPPGLRAPQGRLVLLFDALGEAVGVHAREDGERHARPYPTDLDQGAEEGACVEQSVFVDNSVSIFC